jgi:hypothetical protein
MRRHLSTLVALLAFGVANAPVAVAQDLDARIDRAKEHVKLSKKALKDDEGDLKDIEKILAKWLKANESGNDGKMAKVDESLLEWLQEELAENREDRAAARAELEATGASATPPRSSGGKTRPGQGRTAESAASAEARADYEAEEADLQQTREIAQSLRELQERFQAGTAGPRVREEKEELLRQLVRGARRDVRRATAELDEDSARYERLKGQR